MNVIILHIRIIKLAPMSRINVQKPVLVRQNNDWVEVKLDYIQLIPVFIINKYSTGKIICKNNSFINPVNLEACD
ncbi:hypothetical protein SDC9_143888 [bioreactor metagenome]|uniref:Uncharacterized protein n=1 Tax=bioreactor metagenome TaxID=1076179 RepID=A0A645E7B7_9ZZZZ